MGNLEGGRGNLPIVFWVSDDELMCDVCYQNERAFHLVDDWRPIYSDDPLFAGYTVYCPSFGAYDNCKTQYKFERKND